MGFIRPLIPNANRVLKIKEPMTLPIIISVLFLRAAATQVMSSGNEVPKAMAVREISASDIPTFLAIKMELSITSFPEIGIRMMPAKANKMLLLMLRPGVVSSMISVGLFFDDKKVMIIKKLKIASSTRLSIKLRPRNSFL